MANRRGTKSTDNSTTTNQAATEATATNEEAVVAASTTEAPAEATAEKSESAPVDLTEFQSAVEAAVAAADPTTGEVPEEQLTAVTTAYRALDGLKAKNAAKAAVNETMKDKMNSNDLAGARAALNISEKALVAQAGGSKSSTPADPTENFVQRVATLRLAYNLAITSVPEGVSDDWEAKADALVSEQSETATSYLGWTKSDPESRGEEPEVSVVVRNAAKLATGKAAKAGVSRGGGSFTGERKDIAVHIQSAFEDLAEGEFLTIAQIRSKRSDEYGDNPPSAGAVSARLFPKSGESSMVKFGIQPTTQDGKKGAIKVAIDE